jgi:hypothetical protein
LFQPPPDTSHDLLLCALYHRTFVAQRADEKPFKPTPLPMKQEPLLSKW